MKVTFGNPIDMDIKLVTVVDQPVQKIIGSAGYVCVHQKIVNNEKLIHNPGSRYMGIWHPNSIISSENADEAMKSMITVMDGETYQGRSATIEELASYEVMFYKELEKTILVALGEKVYGGSRKYVVHRYVCASARELSLYGWTGDWAADYRFLVVFERVQAL